MGNSNPTPQEHALSAENKIFQWGIEWWTNIRRQRNFQHLPHLGPDESLNITMESRETPCEATTTSSEENEQKGQPPTVATMHSVKFSCPTTDSDATPLVIFPGYGSGTGIYYTTLPGMCELHRGPVYVVDFLGCGLSTRRPWTLGYGADANLEKSEDYFCDAIEEWRKNMKIRKMVLGGHSMGGYLATAFCERYPESVERLLLVSPVGVPEPDPTIKDRMSNAPWYFRLAFNMWDSGWSPMALPGTWMMLGFHGNHRYNDASWTNKELLRNYFYYNWCNGDPSAGARTHSVLLMPGAFARKPLHSRIPKLRSSIPRISCIYGDVDWMNYDHFEVVKKQVRVEVEADERAGGDGGDGGDGEDGGAGDGRGSFEVASNMPIDVVRVVDGGHNMMVDNPEGFLDAFWKITTEAENDLLNETQGMEDGQLFGYSAWMHERRTMGVARRGAVMEGRSKGPDRKTPFLWTRCEVEEDHGGGTFRVKWVEGPSQGKKTSRLGGHLLRSVEEKQEVGESSL
jgi:pimeloyl-ACP methyl ester carboxylesterase